MNTQYKLTQRKRIQGTWFDDWSSGQLGHMAEYYDDRAEAEAAADKLNAELAQYSAEGLGMSVEEWNDTRAADCDVYWHIIAA